MNELNEYKDYVIDLYNHNNSIKLITEKLYKKVNTYLKAHNKKSGGKWYMFVPELKYKKTDVASFVYRTIYKYVTEEKYNNKLNKFDFVPF